MLDLPPELEPSIPQMLSYRVDGDSHQPGMQRRISPERLSAAIRIPEAVLSQRFGDIPIPYRSENEAKNARPVELDDPVEVLNLRNWIVQTRGNERRRDARLHTIP